MWIAANTCQLLAQVQTVFEILKVNTKLCFAFHLQIDVQINCGNEDVEEYLCCNINYQQDDWTLYLLLVEFEYDKIVYALTQQTSFISTMYIVQNLIY